MMAEDQRPVPESLNASKRLSHKFQVHDRRRVKLASVSEPADYQESHSKTEAVMVKLDQTRLTQMCRRRKPDARLMESLSPEQDAAMDAIGAAFRIISEGMGAGVMRYGEQTDRGVASSSADAEDRRQRLVSRYFEWGSKCIPNGVSHAAIMDIIAYGASPNKVDCDRKKGRGWAKANLMDGLSLYCKIYRIG